MTCLKLRVGSSLPATRIVLELQRLTTAYIQTEDRLRLIGEDQQGGALCLWLTQRLALRFVAHLVDALDIASPEAIKNPSQDQDASKLLQGIAQKAAAADFTPLAAVESTDATQSMFIHEVAVRRAKGGVISLVFKSDEDEEVAIRLNPQQLRQWLSIIHGQWLKAEWPTSIWPEWMGEKTQQADSVESTKSVH